MKKLDTAITSFRMDSIDPSFRSEDQDRCAMLADALEEIRDLLTADKQPNTEDQSTTFEPWDCVRAKPDTELHTYVGDAELVCGHFDSDGDRRVFNPDSDEMHTAYFYSKDSDLIFVRRLKPRTQAEPTYTFKAGSYVKDIRDDVVYEVMQDGNGSMLQLRDIHTNQPAKCLINYLVKVEKQTPAPFQVGDWVRDHLHGNTFQITQIIGEWLYGDDQGPQRHASHISSAIKVDAPAFAVGDWVRDDEDGFEGPIELIFDQGKRVRIKEDTSYYSRSVKYLRKIDPPAPRFTFGQRVRWSEYPNLVHLFICRHKGDQAQIVDDDGLIEYPYLEDLTLDTSAD
jgi:hypothetical protein